MSQLALLGKLLTIDKSSMKAAYNVTDNKFLISIVADYLRNDVVHR